MSENTDKTASGERALWSSVIALAIKDAFSGRGKDREEARHFILGKSRWFNQVCDMAGVNPEWVYRKVHECMGDEHKTRRINDIGKRLENRK